MGRFYVALAHRGQLVGTFARVDGVDLTWDVEGFAAHIKDVRKADLAGVEPWHMTVFGPWSADSIPDDYGAATTGRGLLPNVALSTLGDASGDRFFLLRITAPIAAVAAADNDVVRRVVQQVLDQRDRVDRLNPFLRSHHSDTMSTPSGAGRGSPSDWDRRRDQFKQEVATYYGLDTEDETRLTDMFGHVRRFPEVTLAHIWPRSLEAVVPEVQAALMLPPGFYESPRNFLLLDRGIHDAFDAGHIVLVPTREAVRVHVLREGLLSEDVKSRIRALANQQLVLPRAAEKHVPFKRLLAWFAWLAKGAVVMQPAALAEMNASLAASEDVDAAPLMELLRDAVAARRVSRTIQALALPELPPRASEV